jgi:hypothetical protein
MTEAWSDFSLRLHMCTIIYHGSWYLMYWIAVCVRLLLFFSFIILILNFIAYDVFFLQLLGLPLPAVIKCFSTFASSSDRADILSVEAYYYDHFLHSGSFRYTLIYNILLGSRPAACSSNKIYTIFPVHQLATNDSLRFESRKKLYPMCCNNKSILIFFLVSGWSQNWNKSRRYTCLQYTQKLSCWSYLPSSSSCCCFCQSSTQ